LDANLDQRLTRVELLGLPTHLHVEGHGLTSCVCLRHGTRLDCSFPRTYPTTMISVEIKHMHCPRWLPGLHETCSFRQSTRSISFGRL
jgi:hypothetical protein